MHPDRILPLFVTDRLEATRRFYVEQAGFSVALEMDGYLAVSYGEVAISFVRPDAMTMLRERPFGGHGAILSVPTADADDKARAFADAGVAPLVPVETRPWGWRSFLVRDPNGVLLDFFHVAAETPADAAG
ncbi:MAG TPA: VOC family protein [Planctomycetota bacterium]|nr:VOC family protein [Planctomycetota bacterium]